MPWIVAAIGLHGGFLAWILNSPQAVPAAIPQVMSVALVSPTPAVQAPAPQAKPHPARPPVPAKVARPIAPSPLAAPSNIAAAAPAAAPVPATAPAAAPAPAAVAAPVVAAQFDADYLQNPRPAYPPAARRLGEQGKVWLRAHVLPNGTTDNVEIKQTSGSPRLDTAALEAVKRWRFVPARQGSEPLSSWVVIPISFSLES